MGNDDWGRLLSAAKGAAVSAGHKHTVKWDKEQS